MPKNLRLVLYLFLLAACLPLLASSIFPNRPSAPKLPSGPAVGSSALGISTLNVDFENGNFDTLVGQWPAPLDGGMEGSTGAYFGKGTYWGAKVVPSTTSPAIGNYSAALTIGSGLSTAAYLFTYTPTVPSTGIGMYRASYYIPSTIVPDSWWNIWQWKSQDTTYSKPIVALNLVKINNVLQIKASYVPGGLSTNSTQYVSQTVPVAFPTDKWVNVRGYYSAQTTNTGLVQIFQDDVKILEIANIMTKPGGKPVLWSVNSYADKITPNPATIYIDNMSIESVDVPVTPVPVVNAIPVISTSSIATARVNRSYSAIVQAYDANSTNVLTLSATGLPTGFLFTKTSNTISSGKRYVKYTLTGKSTVKGTWPLVVTAKDDKGGTVSKSFKLVINK